MIYSQFLLRRSIFCFLGRSTGSEEQKETPRGLILVGIDIICGLQQTCTDACRESAVGLCTLLVYKERSVVELYLIYSWPALDLFSEPFSANRKARRNVDSL